MSARAWRARKRRSLGVLARRSHASCSARAGAASRSSRLWGRNAAAGGRCMQGNQTTSACMPPCSHLEQRIARVLRHDQPDSACEGQRRQRCRGRRRVAAAAAAAQQALRGTGWPCGRAAATHPPCGIGTGRRAGMRSAQVGCPRSRSPTRAVGAPWPALLADRRLRRWSEQRRREGKARNGEDRTPVSCRDRRWAWRWTAPLDRWSASPAMRSVRAAGP